MAKTFDVQDPAGYQAYLAGLMTQMALYGGVHMQYAVGGEITILDPEDLAASSQAGFELVMDNGKKMPFPAPAVSVVVP